MKIFNLKPKEEEKNYYKVPEEELIVRDRLAADRTALANERTFLSYIRTALAFAAAGFGILQLYDQTGLIVLGWILISTGIIILIIGTIRFIQFSSTIKELGCAEGIDKVKIENASEKETTEKERKEE